MSLFLGLLLLAGSPRAPAEASPNPWSAVQFMVGEWAGESDGQPGKGTVKRTYRFVLGDKFLHEQNVSTYPPQPKNEKGEVHEHWSFFSYDRARRALVLRQFHQEGFVNQYVMAAGSTAGSVVFESEAFENVPSGWKARETYEVVSPDEFLETFELASGTGSYEVYSRTRFKRVHLVSAVVSSSLIVAASALPQASAPARARIGDLAWMAGQWHGEAGGALSEETWAAPEGDAMVGVWRLVAADGKTRLFELLVLREDEEGVALRLRHFDPVLVGREEKDKPVVLRLTQWGPREAAFEGPSVSGAPGLVRIHYRRPADDTLVAALERPGGRKEEFAFKRRPGS